jgi:hypothetical protein
MGLTAFNRSRRLEVEPTAQYAAEPEPKEPVKEPEAQEPAPTEPEPPAEPEPAEEPQADGRKKKGK